MNIYSELINTFTILIFGSESNFNEVVVTTPLVNNNWLADLINAIIVNLPKVCTIGVIVLMFVTIISIFYLLYVLFKEVPEETTTFKKRGRKRK